MRTPGEIMNELASRVTRPESPVTDIGVVRFDLSGDHSGSWLLRLRPPRSVVLLDPASKPEAPDCIFRLDGPDFVRLFEGKISAQQLFFDGRLEVDGDLGMTLKLPLITRLLERSGPRV